MKVTQRQVIRNSIAGGAINGAINGGISAMSFFRQDEVPITLDSISNQEVTVFGQGVLLAFMLTLILTGINYAGVVKALKKKGESAPPPFWTWGARLALRNALAAFGAAMIIAVLWQRFVSTVMVSPTVATAILFVMAFLFTVYAGVATAGTMLEMRKSE